MPATRERLSRLWTSRPVLPTAREPARAATARRVSGPGDVAVTYDQGMTDGVGSQLHRNFGLYALARALDLKDVHSGLRDVGYLGLMPMLNGHLDPGFTARYNAFFTLPSDDFNLEACEPVRVHSLDRPPSSAIRSTRGRRAARC